MTARHGGILIPTKRWPRPFPSAVRALAAEWTKTNSCDANCTTTDDAHGHSTASLQACRQPHLAEAADVRAKQSP